MTEPAVDPAFMGLIRSDRVSAATRAALLERAEPVAPDYRPAALSGCAFATLRALLSRVLPQRPGAAIDLAARLDAMLAAGTGDGWRYADLPPDRDAWRLGLAGLDQLAQAAGGTAFASLDGAAQDRVLAHAASGDAALPGGWTGTATRHWFGDVRAEAAKLYVAHPATMARIGYGGIGYGGDGARKPGFGALDPGEREPWEPVSAAGGAP